MKKHKFANTQKSAGKVILFGIISETVSLLLFSVLAALLLMTLNDPISAVGIASLAALLLSGALSSFITVKYKGENGFFPAVIASAIGALAIFAVSLIVGGGKISGGVFMNMLCYLAVSAVFALLASRKKKRRFPR